MGKESQDTKGTISLPRKFKEKQKTLTEYLQEIKHKPKMESNCENKK